MGWRIIRYLVHQFYLRHRRGHGIHSPYLFGFLHDVVFNGKGIAVPEWVWKVHRELQGDATLIPGEEVQPGAGSKVGRRTARTVGNFVKRSSVSPRYGALLYRITRWFGPDRIIELGTGAGVSALYLSSGSSRAPMITVEGNRFRADFSRSLIKRCGLTAVKVHRGDFDEALEWILPELKGRFVAFVDGNHLQEATTRYVRSLVDAAVGEAVVIMDDIYWSREMYRAWKEVISWPEVRVSIDLFRMGVLLLRRDLHRAALKVKF